MVALTQTLERPTTQEAQPTVSEHTTEALGGVAVSGDVQLPEVITALEQQPATESQQIINQALIERFEKQMAAKQPAPRKTFDQLRVPRVKTLNKR